VCVCSLGLAFPPVRLSRAVPCRVVSCKSAVQSRCVVSRRCSRSFVCRRPNIKQPNKAASDPTSNAPSTPTVPHPLTTLSTLTTHSPGPLPHHFSTIRPQRRYGTVPQPMVCVVFVPIHFHPLPNGVQGIYTHPLPTDPLSNAGAGIYTDPVQSSPAVQSITGLCVRSTDRRQKERMVCSQEDPRRERKARQSK
jgi:hypothetical protein